MRYVITYAIPGEAADLHVQLTHEMAAQFGIRNVADDIVPHFTLKAPFETDDIGPVDQILRNVASNEFPMPVTLGGIDTFNNRVIFMDAHAPSETHTLIRRLQDELRTLAWLPFYPTEDAIRLHATLGYANDAPHAERMCSWLRAQNIPAFSLSIDALTLLVRGETRWEMHTVYPLRTC
jgi:2'-5' RNA ligase